jgi:hypothetical protein
VFAGLVAPAASADPEPPLTKKEILRRVQGAQFDPAAAVKKQADGKAVQFTPAAGLQMLSVKDVEKGRVIGRLDTTAKGHNPALPPGQYTVFLAKTGTGWQLSYAAEGKVVAQIKDAKVTPKANAAVSPNLGIELCDGHCVCVCLPIVGCIHVYCF